MLHALGACRPPAPIASTARLAVDRVLTRGALTYAVAFAGPRRLLAVELETDFQLVVRDLGGGAPARLRLGPPEYDVADLAVRGDGRAAYLASLDGTVRTVDLDGRPRVTGTWNVGGAVTSVAVSPDGALLAAGTREGVVCLRRQRDGALLQCVAAHEGRVSGLDFDRSGRRLASSAWDGRVTVWGVPTLAVVAELATSGSANRVAFAPDGGLLAIATSAAPPVRGAARGRTGARDGILLWPAFRGGRARALPGHTGPVLGLAWVGRGRTLLSASWDGSIRLWDDRGREVGRIAGLGDGATSVARATAAGGERAAVGSWGPRDRPATTLLRLGDLP